MPEVIISCPFDHLVRALTGDPVKPCDFGETVATHYCFENPMDTED